MKKSTGIAISIIILLTIPTAVQAVSLSDVISTIHNWANDSGTTLSDVLSTIQNWASGTTPPQEISCDYSEIQYCRNDFLDKNLGQITNKGCKDQCEEILESRNINHGCWVKAPDGNCYCRDGESEKQDSGSAGGKCYTGPTTTTTTSTTTTTLANCRTKYGPQFKCYTYVEWREAGRPRPYYRENCAPIGISNYCAHENPTTTTTINNCVNHDQRISEEQNCCSPYERKQDFYTQMSDTCCNPSECALDGMCFTNGFEYPAEQAWCNNGQWQTW